MGHEINSKGQDYHFYEDRIEESPKDAEDASYHSVRLVSLSRVCVHVSTRGILS